MADGEQMTIMDVAQATERLHAELMTAKASDNAQIIHASIIDAIDGLLRCTRTLAAELLKVEIEGLDKASF